MSIILNKKNIITFFLFIIFLAIPSLLPAQTRDPFAALDKMFNQVENPPTPEDEYFFGRAVAANILSAYRPYTRKKEVTDYLNLICQTLVINSPLPAAVYNDYHVMILNSREYNAFTTPGGHIFITRSLVNAATCEDALAGIIAHEMAHLLLKHGIKMLDDMRLFGEIDDMAAQAAAFSGNQGQRILTFRDSVNDYFNTMVKNGYSVEQEFEADATAAQLLAAAGYNPLKLLDMFRVLQKFQSGRKGGFNNTHPSPAERIAKIERQMLNYGRNDTSALRHERFTKIMGKKAQ